MKAQARQQVLDFDSDQEDEEDQVEESQPRLLPKLEPGIIYLDSRVGSKELAPLLQKRHGLKTSLITLNSADVAFRCGHAEPSPYCAGDFGCVIGVERKTLSDLIGSLLKNRLGGKQIPDMLREYTKSVVVIEGEWRAGDEGQIEQVVWRQRKENGIELLKWAAVRGPLTYHQLQAWLTRYMVQGNGKLSMAKTGGMIDTAAWVSSTYGWWRKEWKKHSVGVADKMPVPEKALLRRLNEKEKMIASVPGIGIKGMNTIARRFPAYIDMVLASPRQLQEAGLRKAVSYQVWKVIRREFR